MVFVNTTLETALKRNKYVERGRPVPEHIVIKSHKEVQAKIRVSEPKDISASFFTQKCFLLAS